jgi:hypothetical protein
VIDPELWIKLVFRGVRTSTNLVISDVRFINELISVSHRKGFVWRIIRPEAGLEGAYAGHVSEKELVDDPDLYDAVIYNDGTLEDLTKKVAAAFDACR